MAITVKHSKVSTIPDDADTSLVRPSDWNADHTLTGTIPVDNGGTGASTLTGYVYGNGTSAMTASTTIPSGDVSGLGTIATQNANAVAITGGTINSTSIGATTPAAGTFTTITGQTEVLRGTGTNLLTYSQTFTNGVWVNNLGTVTANAGTAPDSTNTATNFIPSNTSTSFKELQQNISITQGINYTFSAYFKQNGYQYIQLIANAGSFGTYALNYDLSNGTETYFETGTSTIVSRGITSAGNGWYRVYVTATALATLSASARFSANIVPASGSGRGVAWTGNGTSGILAWGYQIEVGTTANTYIPTTTTAVYGTPTLSFSGVAGLGLESNGSLYVSPAGTGAIQAQATTSTTAGGNARGANAVDWQTKRSAASQVASGLGSVICGGEERNTASGQQSFVGTGFNNNSSAYGATIVAGVNGSNAGNSAFIGAGNAHTIGSNGAYSVVVGGNTNTGSGRYNFIGGGTLNSGTSGTVVATQATTAVTNGSTAVTLSASNAAIKVGQLINGTGISENTYVAAISGTSLTLSQNATATGTPTLVFFTPHGVVVGGGNNQATGSYSFIGGGGDAGTAANRNVASGDWSFVGGGTKNIASGFQSLVVGGNNATASGINSAILMGATSSVASGSYSTLLNGTYNNSSGTYSTVINGSGAIARGITGYTVFGGIFGSTVGDTQAALLVIKANTSDATPTVLTVNNSAAGTTNQVILPNNSAYFFTGELIAGVTGGGNTKGWTIEGVIKRGANAAATSIVGTATVTSLYADAGAATWTVTALADTTNGGLKITVTGQAATTIRWVAQIRTTEMTF